MKKLSYVFVLAALIMLSASSSRADTVPADDPRIGGGGGSCAFVDLTSLTQGFSVPTMDLYPPTGPCIIDFTNETNTTLTSLAVTVNASFTGNLGCYILNGESPFSVATLTAPNTCTFSGGSVPDEGVFGLQFGDALHPFCSTTPVNGVCTTPEPLDVTLHPTPEPASIALIGTGLAALVAHRKRLGSEPLAS
jgi:hypothetical protein